MRRLQAPMAMYTLLEKLGLLVCHECFAAGAS